METQGQRLKAARLAAGFKTAGAAARAHDWNASTYRGHEAGPREISKSAAIEYARAFGVSIAWLLTGVEIGGVKNDERLGDDDNVDSATTRGAELLHERIGLKVVPVLSWSASREMASKDAFKINAAAVDRVAVADTGLSGVSFALKIRDDGMSTGKPDALAVGDVVIIDPEAQVAPGKIVVAWDRATDPVLGRYKVTIDPDTKAERIIVRPGNDDFPPLVMAKGDEGFVYRAVAVLKPL